MLTKIGLEHFKCFERLEMECATLNLLCGLNGTGKSSVIQALLVLRQSLEAGELQRGRLVLGGERIDLGMGSDVLFEDAEHDVLRFMLVGGKAEERSWQLTFDCPRSSDLLGASAEVTAKGDYVDAVREENTNVTNSIAPPARTRRESPTDNYLQDWEAIPPFGGYLVYVNAERVGPRKFYPLSDIKARRGDFGDSVEYAWNYLDRNQDELLPVGDPRSIEGGARRLIDVVDHWLQHVCPGAHLQLEAIVDADAVIAGFSFERAGDVASRTYRATNVGFGLSYTLPVIAALLSPPGTLCLIENPEAHLHPRGQTKLAELAARASRAGVQVFVETHSDHFMDGVRMAVREGLIEPGDAAFHYFERDDNKSVITSLVADSDGRLSRWPTGFFDQHEENLAKLIAPRS